MLRIWINLKWAGGWRAEGAGVAKLLNCKDARERETTRDGGRVGRRREGRGVCVYVAFYVGDTNSGHGVRPIIFIYRKNYYCVSN